MELEHVGPYNIIRRLGYGGMCEVYLAECYGASGFVRPVALKLLLPEYRGDGRYEKLLIKEAKLGAQLTHRNLVHVHDFGVDQGIHYMRIDYVDGADLHELLSQDLPGEQLAYAIAAELAQALIYLHELTDQAARPLGLVHRDISPANVMLSRSGEVKLTDFGVMKATKLATNTQGRIRKGKYAYMSPEQVRGQRLDATSDQFALGITLMEMLCGRRPYDGAHAMETLERIEAARPPNLDGLPERSQALVARLLAPAPQDRYPSMREVYEELIACIEHPVRASANALATWVRSRRSLASS